MGGSVFRQDPGYLAYRIGLSAPLALTGVQPDGGATETIFVVSPNPLVGPATISLRNKGAGFVSVKVFDVTGRDVRRLFEGQAVSGTMRFTWDLRDERGHAVGSGVYFLKARTPDGAVAQRVVVLH